LDELVNNNYFKSQFYFTGGTALSHYYLQHRYSEDLDFFSENKFENLIILSLVEELRKKYHFNFQSRFAEVVYRFNLIFKNGTSLKVDFGYYPYKRVEKGMKYKGLAIDSLLDISINKLMTVNQRTDIKDFVDLYYLLDKFTIWDLIEGIRVKFHQENEPLLIAYDLLKIEDFVALPKMIKPLTLPELKSFFKLQAVKLGAKVVKK
jgi:predicted nucleotidyltransferase component of viral defense system